ncbi:MAG: C25 family cysteine peptidase [Microscillaceae bacterium]|nr:C25 family cysteine peptidase [Microscillaceae bacterium]MDW8461001.1 C25 family cysteine peptidase [Cytophagales bacterium]
MKLVILLLLSWLSKLQAQVLVGNEWINPHQQYYKIPITQRGMYRITYNNLQNAGIPLASINPQKFQIFKRGQEQAIRVEGESDGVFDPTDFIDFYAEGNDGTQDAGLYRAALLGQVTNPYYNLYSDTAAYFLTWRVDAGVGKRIPTYSEAPNLANLETHHFHEHLIVFSERFSAGQNYPQGSTSGIYLASFDIGEGWVSNPISTTPRNTIIPIQNPLNFGIPTLQVGLVGADYLFQSARVNIGNSLSNLRLVGLANISFFSRSVVNTPIAFGDYTGTGQTIVQVLTTQGVVSITHILLRYAQSFDMAGQSEKYFNLVPKLSGKSFIAIPNAPSNAVIYDITDLNNLVHIGANRNGNTLEATVNNTQTSRKLYVFSENNILPITSIQAVTFHHFNPANYNYLIVTHKSLRKPAGGYNDIVQAYADYRASQAGGGHKPLIMDIDVLYNQFNYGERSPMAIKNFVRYMYRNNAAKFLFLIGRGYCLPDGHVPINIRQNPAHAALDLVPTGGWPPSDYVFSTDLEPGKAAASVVPTGRLNVDNPQHILNYLNKVKEHDAEHGAVWKKNVIHLSGGKTLAEQAQFRAFMKEFEDIIKGDYLGARVTSASKRTTNSVEIINISEMVNAGVGLVTFFGHSNQIGTDIEIGFASDDLQGYRNKGRYPVMLANGCQLSSIFYGQVTLSEDWMHTADRGSIAFIGHTYFGYSNLLRTYTFRFYYGSFGDSTMIGKSIGENLVNTYRLFADPLLPLDLSLLEQMLLQGDPAVKLSVGSKPDYEVRNNDMFLESTNNERVNAFSETFKLRVIVGNLGRTDPKPFKVSVKRTFPDGTIRVYNLPQNFAPVRFKDTLTIIMQREASLNAFGLNKFEVTVDYLNEVAELSENNNTGVYEVFIPSVGVIPLLPLEYSIVNEQPVTLTALASSLRDEGRQIIFELDTVATFNSPAKKSFIAPSGITATWSVNLLANTVAHDSTVYYWRTNYLEVISDPNNLWGVSSFTYIRNSPEGWSQRQHTQFDKNATLNTRSNPVLKRWEFVEIRDRMVVNTFGSTAPANLNTDVSAIYKGLPLVAGTQCGSDVIVAITIRSSDNQPVQITSTNACGRNSVSANYFTNQQIHQGMLRDYINLVPIGYTVVLFTVGTVDFSTWDANMRNMFALIGGNTTSNGTIQTLRTGHPYIIMGKKGSPIGSAIEVIANTFTNQTAQIIRLDHDVITQVGHGSITSTRIGPASGWRLFENRVRTFPNDEYKFDLIGVDLQANETVLMQNITAQSLNLNFINATQYPYLKIRLNLKDTINYDPAQLRKWLVLYDGEAEGFLNPDIVGREKYNVADKQEGENFELEFAFQNISNYPFRDSITVEYSIFNVPTRNQTAKQFKIKALLAKEVARFKIPVNTLGIAGENVLKVYVNPKILPELYYENNILEVPFKVLPDKINPILEVAFDGRQIMNGEIVSPSPLITIVITDENKFIQRKDTSGISIALKRPCANCGFEPIYFSNPDVRWSVQGGKTSIEFHPKNLANGVYTLRVQGTDASGNRSGIMPYSVDFEVVNEASVTNFLPYPNPFSTSTRFVFTLTGSEIPDQMKIQILTISGKVVREITQDEIGTIRIGNNITQYAWDGTDEFGDKLANGVYLYRVVMRINGKEVEHRSSATDKAFKNGYGKIYIAR